MHLTLPQSTSRTKIMVHKSSTTNCNHKSVHFNVYISNFLEAMFSSLPYKAKYFSFKIWAGYVYIKGSWFCFTKITTYNLRKAYSAIQNIFILTVIPRKENCQPNYYFFFIEGRNNSTTGYLRNSFTSMSIRRWRRFVRAVISVNNVTYA